MIKKVSFLNFAYLLGLFFIKFSIVKSTIPSCPTTHQYDIIKGQVNLIKYIQGTSFYAVVDSQNKFLLADVDSGDIKASYQSFQDTASIPGASIQAANNVVTKEGTSIYVVTPVSVSIRDLSNMSDQTVALQWNKDYPQASIKIFKVDPSDSNIMYFGAEYPQGTPPAILVAFQNSNQPGQVYQLTVTPPPVGPPTTVSIITIAIKVTLSGSLFNIVVGYSGTQLYFSFISSTIQGPGSNPSWDILMSFPSQYTNYLTHYFVEKNNVLYIAFQGQNGKQIFTYDLTQFTFIQNPGQPPTKTWNPINPVAFANQLQQSIQKIYYLSTSTDDYLFISVEDKAQQQKSQYLIFGKLSDYSNNAQTSQPYTNQVTSIEYITGTSTVILGTASSEIIHFNFISKSNSIKKQPSLGKYQMISIYNISNFLIKTVEQYNAVIRDSSGILYMFSSSQLFTQIAAYNFSTQLSNQPTNIQQLTDLESVYGIAVYDQTRFARAILVQTTIPNPPPPVIKHYFQIEIQINSSSFISTRTANLFEIIDTKAPISVSMIFLSSTSIAVLYSNKDSNWLAVFTYTNSPSPSLSKSAEYLDVVQGQGGSMIADSNNNIIIPKGPDYFCYQFKTNVLNQIKMTFQMDPSDTTQTSGLFFLPNTLYIAVFKSGPSLGQKQVLAIFSYDSSTMATTFIARIDTPMQTSNLKYQSSLNLIVFVANAQYYFIKFDTIQKTLTQILYTQALGSKNIIDYFIDASGYILIIQSVGIIKFQIDSTCLSTVCKQCAIDAYYNIPLSLPSPTSLTDSNGSGTEASSYSSQAKFYTGYWEIINTFSSLNGFDDVFITNYIKLGSQFINQQYLFNIYSVFSQGLLGTPTPNQKYAQINIKFTSFGTPSPDTTYSYIFSNTLTLPSNLYSASFENLKFCQQLPYEGAMIDSSTTKLNLQNIIISTSTYQVTNLRILLSAGDEFNLKSTTLTNIQFTGKVPTFLDVKDQLTVTLDTVIFDNCLFDGASLISGQNPAPLVIIKDSSIINSTIQSKNGIMSFIQFASLTITSLNINNNKSIKDVLLFQNQEYSPPPNQPAILQNIDISSFTMKQNTINFSSSQSVFGFSITYQQVNLQPQFTFKDSEISSNVITVYSPVPPDPTQVDNESLKKISENFLITADNVQQVTFNNVKYKDNGGTGFMLGEQMINVDLQVITCSQTTLSSQNSQASCLSFLEHSKLNLSISKSEFSNISVQNTYIIQIKTSSFTEVGKNMNDCIVTISSTTFSNINIKTDSAFITSSIIYYDSLQKDKIVLDTVKFLNVNLNTTPKVFSPLGSALTIYAPFSTLVQKGCTFSDLTSNGPKLLQQYNQLFILEQMIFAIDLKRMFIIIQGPQEINVREINIESGTFKNSNFKSIYYTQSGGFGKITAYICKILQSTFNNAQAFNGGALILIPTVSSSQISIIDCQFRLLASQEDGGAISIQSTTDKSLFTISGGSFEYIFAAKTGGCINVQYVLPTSDAINYSNCPIVHLTNIKISNVFAQKGSIISGSNLSANIDTLTISQVDSNIATTSTDNITLDSFFAIYKSIGPLFDFSQCVVNLNDSTFDSLKIHSSSLIDQDTNFIFALSSTLKFNKVTISNFEFSNKNFIVVISSFFYPTTLTLDVGKYKVQTNSRLLAYTMDINSGISVILVQKSSYIEATSLTVKGVTCDSTSCYGGGLLISSSYGTISSSTFTSNTAYVGGGLAIYNPSNSITITGTTFTGNTATEDGGGLFFKLVDTQQILTINSCTLTGNFANIGGGASFFQIANTQTDPTKPMTIINDSTVSQNTSNMYGGGLSFTGITPTQINTSVTENISKTKFGSDTFSYPSKLVWNEELTNKGVEKKIQITKKVENGIDVYVLPDQLSAKTVVPLIFDLVDSVGSVIDTSYTSQLSENPTSSITVDPALKDSIYLPLTNTYLFDSDGYFSYNKIQIAGIPGATVRLFVKSSAIIDPITKQQTYKIILEFKLHYCQRGEVFKYYDIITDQGTKTFAQCIYCNEGYYSIIYPTLEDKTEHTCQKCSYFATCPGGDVIDLSQSYWRINDQDDQIISCENAPSNCLGGKTNSTCSEGHIGPLCESCDIAEGFTRAGNYQCASCGDVVINAFKVIGLMTFYVISAKMSVNGILGKIQEMWQKTNQEDAQVLETNASIILKLFLNYIQIFMVMTTFNISIPKTFDSGVSSISSPTVQVLYSFECFFYQITEKTGINLIYIAFIFDLILPIICVCMFILSGFITYRKNLFFRSFYVYTSLFYCLMYFQPNIFKDAISLISCRDIGKKSYIRFNVFYECGTEEYDVWTTRLVLPVLIILVIIIPAVLVWRIKANQHTKLGVRKFSFMTSEYQKKAYFWEIVKMNLKLFIMCSLTFFEHDIPNKIMFILFLVVFYGVLLFVYQPYQKELYNKIDSFSIAVLVISIYFGFIAFYNTTTFWIWLISIIIILVLNVIFIVWCIQKLILAYLPLIKTQQKGFFDKLLSIKFFRKYFKKEKRVRFLWMFWMRSVINQLRKMGIYNPLSLNPQLNKFSYAMIIKALREVNKEGQIQIVYDHETHGNNNENEDEDEKDSQNNMRKKYLKIQVLKDEKYDNLKFITPNLASDSPFQQSQLTNDLPLKTDQIQLDSVK